MIYTSTKACVKDLEKHGHLIRIQAELDPDLEMAEVHRRVFQAKGPALLFERVKGSPFPAVSNLFGTLERSRFIFRSTLKRVKQLVRLAADPSIGFKAPWQLPRLLKIGYHALPRKVSAAPVLEHKTTINQLPQIRCWPDDGGAFILLPQVYSENPCQPGILRSNLGMYRIQISGNNYIPNREIGLHYQIQRNIAHHHAGALKQGKPLPVSVFVGGPPAHTFTAVMPLPPGLPEIAFAGALGGRRFRYCRDKGFVISAEADFCITGTIALLQTRTEGPFGDHLGYYSLQHEFPFLNVERVYHRNDAIWPFTVVGRPPQEDTSFGQLIHEITGPMVPKEIPGLVAIHAVDAAGVHPLLLAIGKERFVPYQPRRPQEILTIANAILGYGQCSLAKYVIITAWEDNPNLNIHAIEAYFSHVLTRVDWREDLHFQTRTTMDTLDYSGTGLNAGSKVVIAVAGPEKRQLSSDLPAGFDLPPDFKHPRFCLPGILVIEALPFKTHCQATEEVEKLSTFLEKFRSPLETIPLIVLADDSEFTSRNVNNFLWITFTRSNPSHDIYGIKSLTEYKHWGCEGSLIIDARIKPHHAPPLIEDPAVTARIDQLAKRGGPLYNIV